MAFTCDELREQLADAEEAVRVARLGRQVQSIHSGEKTTTFAPLPIAELLRNLYDLRAKVADCDGTAYHVRRAIPIIPSDSGQPRGPRLRRRS